MFSILSHTQIMKRDIDEFRPERPASCELTVTRQKEDEHPRDLKYCINLSGLQQPDYVLLKIPASETGKSLKVVLQMIYNKVAC